MFTFGNMKVKTLLLTAFILSSIDSFSTHYRGADITFKTIGNYQIEATVTTYSKFDATSGMADRDTIVVWWGDGTSSVIARSNGVDLNMNGYPDGVIISTSPSIKKNEYTGLHTYSGMPPNGFFIISFFDVNRIDGIINIDAGQSVNVPLYVEDTIFAANFINGTLNSSPVFIVPPIDYACTSDTFTFNPVVYDADGDSITVEFITPLQDEGQHVPVYSSPDLFCQMQGQMNSFIHINLQTGQIRWAPPCTLGTFNIALLVHEYRCGVLLSTVMRDMQIIALNFPNYAPLLSPVSDYVIQTGASISLVVSATDVNSFQSVSLAAYGGAFLDTLNPPVFQSTAGNPASGTFNWNTSNLSAKKHPYIFSIVASDDYQIGGNPPDTANLKTYRTFRVWIEDTTACLFTGVNDLRKVYPVSISPNPFTSFINITTDKAFHYSISDYLGRVVLSGETDKTIETEALASGNYILTIKNEEMVMVRKMVKY